MGNVMSEASKESFNESIWTWYDSWHWCDNDIVTLGWDDRDMNLFNNILWRKEMSDINDIAEFFWDVDTKSLDTAWVPDYE